MEQPMMKCLYTSEQIEEQMKLMEYIEFLNSEIESLKTTIENLEYEVKDALEMS